MIALRSISKLRLVAVVVAAAVALILSTATSAAQTFPLYVVSYTETVPANVSQIDDAGTVLPVALVPGKPNTVVEDDSGNLYVCMERSPDVTKIAPDGTQSVYATGFWGGCFGLLFGDSGKLYVSNEYFGQIDVVTPGGGHVKTLATGLTGPKHIAFDPEGNILVAELQAGRVSSIDRKGTVTTLATGLAGPMDVEVGPDGEVYVTEVFAGRITKLTSSGPVTVSEAVPMPTGMEFHADGRLFVAAFDAEKVFTVDITDGTAAVFAAVPRPMDIHFGGSTAQARADVLGSSGIPGKGLGKAPGLQKEFNEKSAAADHAGMKK